MLGVMGCVGNNPSPTSTNNTTILDFISERQPSPLELAFRVELGLYSHSKESKMVLELFN